MPETIPPCADAAIAVENVRKVYGATVAVDDVSFEISRGSPVSAL